MRYLPLSDDDRRAMCAAAGIGDPAGLYAGVPDAARVKPSAFALPPHADEWMVERQMQALASASVTGAPCFCGAGAYRHHIPASVDHLIQRSEFLTSYTPYQPEISQGTLQYLFEFQTQVALLTGMEVANASMYDGSTATAEAVLMALRISGRKKIVLSGALHPHYAATVKTLAGLHGEIRVLPPDPLAEEDLIAALDQKTAAVVVQTPDVFGHLRDLTALADAAHAQGALLIAVVTECISLGLVTAPGAMGADIVVGEGQSLGGGLSFGGPYVGLFSTREKYVRQMPGRLCGETVDADGRRGFVLTLSTREQHIRREKATSNICTNSGLCALAFTIHLTLLGDAGLSRLARINHRHAVRLAERLVSVAGVSLLNKSFFNEFTLRLPAAAAGVVDALADKGILAGVPVSRLCPGSGMDNLLIVAATEMVGEEESAGYAAALAEVLA